MTLTVVTDRPAARWPRWIGASYTPPLRPPDRLHEQRPARELVKDPAVHRRVGLVMGRFSPPHLGHQFLVEEAYERCGLLAVVVPLAPKIDGSDVLRKRHKRAVRATFAREAEVHFIRQPVPPTTDPKHLAWWAEAVRIAVAERITHVFTSDPASSGPLAKLLGAEVVVIDEGRARFPLQGRLLRPDLLRNFGAVAPGARRALGVTVGIVGAESCGKSTMARELGAFFDCPVLEDPLRAFANERPDRRPLSIDYDVAAGRADILLETACREGSRAVVVSDATAMMARVWSERFIDPPPRSVIPSAELEQHDLWLHLLPDLPFDGLPERDDPAGRAWTTERLRTLLASKRGTVVEISGSGQDRINAAIDAVEAARDQALGPWARLPGPASR